MSKVPTSWPRPRRTRQAALAGVALAAGLVLATSPVTTAAAAADTTASPRSMAALGDSISQAFNTHADPATVPSPPDITRCPDGQGGSTGFPFDCPPNSWSTGTNPAVNSIYQRLLASDPALAGHATNDAVSGITVSDLNRQAQLATAQGAAFVTVDIGVNDACTPTVAAETPLSTFRSQFAAGLEALAASPAHPTIQVISIPNILREWQLFHADANAQFRWNLAQICQSMFTNPTSTQPADVARRLAVEARIVAYNIIEADVCAHTPQCSSDRGAVFAWPFTTDQISTVTNTGRITNVPALANFPVFGPGIPNSTGDYFHPSVTGQAAIAAIAWAESKFARRR